MAKREINIELRAAGGGKGAAALGISVDAYAKRFTGICNVLASMLA